MKSEDKIDIVNTYQYRRCQYGTSDHLIHPQASFTSLIFVVKFFKMASLDAIDGLM